MFRIVYVFCLFFLVSGLYAQSAYEIQVEIEGFESDKGKVHVGLYDTAQTWLEEVAVGKVNTIENGKSVVVFENIPAGTYAVSCYHDQNNNEILDLGWFGIPKEPYACSNGAKGRMGPPVWKDAIFDIKQDMVVEIRF